MKGVVFTEFIEMVEDRFGFELADRIIETSELASGGAYTSVGTYDHHELIALLTKLSEETKTPAPDLLKAFGHYLFGRFVQGYPQVFEGLDDAIQVLSQLDEIIHPEVRKLYPDAELPTFENHLLEPRGLEMVYRSPRPFGDLAEGLVHGCIEHFGNSLHVTREDSSTEDESVIRFLVE